MATVGLSAGFTTIPEGEHIFKIVSCTYKEKFGKIEVNLVNQDGQKHTERYNVKSEGGLNAFSFMAKTALQDFSLTEIDHEDLVGKFFKGDVEHTVQPHRDDPNKTVTFINIKNKSEADGFGDSAAEPTATENKKETKPKYDLSFLNN